MPNQVDIDEHPEVENNRECLVTEKWVKYLANNHKETIVTLDGRKSKFKHRFSSRMETKLKSCWIFFQKSYESCRYQYKSGFKAIDKLS